MKIDKSKVKIRRISKDEIPVLVEYRIAYLTELQGTHIKTNKNLMVSELKLYFKKMLEEGRFFALYAELEGKILSFGGMILKEIPGDFKKSTYLEGDILNMYTIPEARCQGISTMILEQLILEAKNIGISKVALHTSKDGEVLYRNYGFSEPVYPYLELVINTENFKH